MTLKTRQILFTTFVLIFVILTPLISLYASGYKIGSGFNLQKTGILILDSKPNDAKIYINNKIQQSFINQLLKKEEGFITTPEKIKNLLPGDYTIKIEKDGYWPWEKKLTIKPGESTFAEDVILFKKDFPVLIKNGNSDNPRITLVDNTLISINNNILNIQLESGESRDFILPEINAENIKVSPDKNKVIIGQYVYNLNDLNSDPLSLNKLIGVSSANIQWGKNDNELYYINNSMFNFFDISAKKFTSLFHDATYSDFLIRDNYIYFISKNNSISEMNIFDQSKNEMVRKISLPSSDYIFKNPEHKTINLYDKNHEILYLVDPFSPFKPLQETISNVKQSNWLDENTLIFANSFEIWSLNINTSQKTLLTRIGNEIKDIATHPKKNYLFFSTETGVYVIELDNREKYNITELLKLEKMNNLIINKKGDTLFFYAKIEEQEGVYKLGI